MDLLEGAIGLLVRHEPIPEPFHNPSSDPPPPLGIIIGYKSSGLYHVSWMTGTTSWVLSSEIVFLIDGEEKQIW